MMNQHNDTEAMSDDDIVDLIPRLARRLRRQGHALSDESPAEDPVTEIEMPSSEQNDSEAGQYEATLG